MTLSQLGKPSWNPHLNENSICPDNGRRKLKSGLDGAMALTSMWMRVVNVMFEKMGTKHCGRKCSRRKLFASCHVDPSGALKFIKQDMDKVMQH